MAAGVVSMAAGAEAFAAATAAEVIEAVTVEAASAVATEVIEAVTEVIEAVTVAGDMDAVTVTEAAGGMGLASG
jgi:hypothetical protein